MNVGQLKKLLNKYNDETMVVMLPNNSYYIENIYDVYSEYVEIRDKEEDVKVVILEATRQVGIK